MTARPPPSEQSYYRHLVHFTSTPRTQPATFPSSSHSQVFSTLPIKCHVPASLSALKLLKQSQCPTSSPLPQTSRNSQHPRVPVCYIQKLTENILNHRRPALRSDMVRECPRCHQKFPTDAALNRHSYHTHIVRSTPPSSPTRATEPQHQPSLPQPAHVTTTPQTHARIPTTTNRPHTTTPGHPNNYRRPSSTCQFCGLSFSPSRLQHHIQTVHLSSSTAIRTASHHRLVSGPATRSSTSGSSHTPSRSPSSATVHSATVMRRYPCEVCGQSFATTSSRNQHVKDAHQKLQIHECRKCGTRFTRHSSLVDHMNNIHGGGNPFKCPWCDASFGKKWILQEHKTTCRKRAGASSSTHG